MTASSQQTAGMVRNGQKPIIKYAVRVGELAVKNIETDLGNHGLGGLAASHLEIITFLLRKGPSSMQVLSHALERDKSTITVLVRKLVSLGFVSQNRSTTDGRVTMVALTAKGAALRGRALKIFIQAERALTQKLSAEEAENLFVLLEKVYRGLAGQNR